LLLVCLLEQGQRVPDSYDKQGLRDDVDVVVRAVPPDCTSFFWAPRLLPGATSDEPKTQLDAMWAGLRLGMPTVNGYSSNFPRDWRLIEHAIATAEDERRLRAALEDWNQGHALDACFVSQGSR
jgi:hypothetical protein